MKKRKALFRVSIGMAAVLFSANLVPAIAQAATVSAESEAARPDSDQRDQQLPLPPSSPATSPDPATDPAEPIDQWMPNRKLQQLVLFFLQGLGDDAGKTWTSVADITKADLAKLKILMTTSTGLPEYDIQVDLPAELEGTWIDGVHSYSLEGLQYATNLEQLWLGSLNLHVEPGIYVGDITDSDLAILTQLPQLTHLGLQGNRITDVRPLTKLSHLRELVLTYNQIADFSALDANNYTNLEIHSQFVQPKPVYIDPETASFDLTPGYFNARLKLPKNYQSTDPLSPTKVDDKHLDRILIENPTHALSFYNAAAKANIIFDDGATENGDTTDSMGTIHYTHIYPQVTPGDVISPEDNPVALEQPYYYYMMASLGTPATGEIFFVAQPYTNDSLAQVNAHDSAIYVGDGWKAADNFDSAVGVDGQTPVAWSDIKVTGKVDLKKPGTYPITYTSASAETTINVTVKENRAQIEVRDQTIAFGTKWDPAAAFVSAYDRDGRGLSFQDLTVSGTVDTGKPGVYQVRYSYGNLTKTATITVKAPAPSEPEGTPKPPNPVDPEQPGTPTAPEKPTNPSQPTNPDKPTKPSQPAIPDKPAIPSQPARPDKPTNPSQPTGPSKPTPTEQPTNPIDPAQSTPSTEPTLPETSETHPKAPASTAKQARKNPQPNALQQTPVTFWILLAVGLTGLAAVHFWLRKRTRTDGD
ncbi:bacterial Ig-like domain-containing protein [Lapidilactobacillus achengensis]|uniref:Bacterial Ig-like domain-containing protein n=1 Tax=Lapidilactobacillus achengensis TaxID=2486000 RepID=A0ABW1UKN7_9LACO|nr:bacterial Ig-like domain-containing protein [Lapidilactobacillus achengensis]